MSQHEQFMRQAILLAQKAADLGEIPVGALIVKDGQIIASGYNQRESKKNALLHAELVAIEQACHTLNNWRLTGCTLYVTLEPCPMCSGAIINARIPTVVFGTNDLRAGCCGSVMNMFAMPFNHTPIVIRGILQNECKEVLDNFFTNIRK